MSFKLTYATMFEPPPELHSSFEAAVARVREQLGGRQALFLNGEDRAAERYFTKTNPADTSQVLGEFPAAGPEDADAALRAAAAAWPAWRRTPVAERARLLRRVAQLIEERVYDLAAVLSFEVGKNRMEALGETQEAADFFTLYSEDFERHGGFDRPLPND
ncbi:MAG TPA: aldehyde dehydrogenase family protein, partial [Steroidobacteraceae bacterium]|nr:aldehyde dehydrogenase family protein [Steroidobacteraceae bacterium]